MVPSFFFICCCFGRVLILSWLDLFFLVLHSFRSVYFVDRHSIPILHTHIIMDVEHLNWHDVQMMGIRLSCHSFFFLFIFKECTDRYFFSLISFYLILCPHCVRFERTICQFCFKSNVCFFINSRKFVIVYLIAWISLNIQKFTRKWNSVR